MARWPQPEHWSRWPPSAEVRHLLDGGQAPSGAARSTRAGCFSKNVWPAARIRSATSEGWLCHLLFRGRVGSRESRGLAVA